MDRSSGLSPFRTRFTIELRGETTVLGRICRKDPPADKPSQLHGDSEYAPMGLNVELSRLRRPQ